MRSRCKVEVPVSFSTYHQHLVITITTTVCVVREVNYVVLLSCYVALTLGLTFLFPSFIFIDIVRLEFGCCNVSFFSFLFLPAESLSR